VPRIITGEANGGAKDGGAAAVMGDFRGSF